MLFDPLNLVSLNELDLLNKKLSQVNCKLFFPINQGGYPLIAAYVIDKPHELRFTYGKRKIYTSATNGIKFFWNPELLKILSLHEVKIIMIHEMTHVLMNHVNRGVGKNSIVWGATIDFITNAFLMNLFQGEDIWTQNIGKPISIENYILYLKGREAPALDDFNFFCYGDLIALQYTAEALYRKLLFYWETSPRRCTICDSLSVDPKKIFSYNRRCNNCDSKINNIFLNTDLHISTTKAELSAIELQYKENNLSVPSSSGIEFELSLSGKKNNLLQIEVIQLLNNLGLHNNWKRYNKRYYANSILAPTKRNKTLKWMVVIDTSASMNDKKIKKGLEALIPLIKNSEGYLLSNDSKSYWDNIKRINNINDLLNVKLVGRGGTSFDKFFLELSKKQFNLDAIFIITDGLFSLSTVNTMVKHVYWIIINDYSNFKPKFGRVITI
jgi:hypothetical protein